MADFSNLKALDVNADTLVEYTFALIPGAPSIWLAPATDENRLFLNERLKLNAERAEKLAEEQKGRPKGVPAKIQITADDFDLDRDSDRDLLARCCIKRWGNPPKDVNGDCPEFDLDNCRAFLQALPTYLLDGLRNFAANLYNFIPRLDENGVPISPDAKAAVGNS